MSWQAWSLADWNRRLFDYFFGLREDDVDIPVTRLLLTPEELLRVVGGSGFPEAVRQEFVNLFRDRLHSNGQTLGTDALRLSETWSPASDAEPPFLVHLLFTCFASADSDEDVVDDLNFRRRLTALLRGGIHHGLEKLVPLWKALSTWLRAQRSRGRRIRELQLPDIGHLTIIGYSVRLAFPTYRDQARLIELLGEFDLETEPPVRDVVRAVAHEISRFSTRFQAEFAEFRRKYGAADPDLYETALWAAVRHAARVSRVRGEEESRSPRLGLALEPDLSGAGGFVLILLAEDRIPRTQGHLQFHPLERAIEEFTYAVTSTSRDADAYQQAIDLLLSGDLRESVPRAASGSVMRNVAHGVLLFERVEGGVYLLRSSRPEGPDIAVIVRDDLTPDFVAACREVSSGVEPKPASCRGWQDVRVTAQVLARAPFDRFKSLRDIPCLQEVLRPARPRFIAGVRVDNAWLGRFPRLPNVVAQADRVTAVARRPAEGEVSVHPLVLSRDQPNLWTFPSLAAGVHIDGSVTVTASSKDREPTTTAEFVASVLGHDYPAPTDPLGWFTESATSAVTVFDGADPVTRELGVTDQNAEPDAARLQEFLSVDPSVADGGGGPSSALGRDEFCRLDDAVEILAGLALQRRGLPEIEFLAVLRDVFGLRSQLVYEVARAWVENGLFDRLIYRRWRGVSYFARRPRLVVYPQAIGFGCVLDGLAPSALRQRIIRAVQDAEAQREERIPRNPWVPTRIAFTVSSLNSLRRLSEQLGLDSPRFISDPALFLGSVAEVVSTREAGLPNYLLVGRVDPRTGRVHQEVARQEGDVLVEWYRRPDLPDYFVVHRPGQSSWWTHSRTWALLAALLLGETPFALYDNATLHRSFRHSTYLPLPVARLASIVGRVGSGPHPDRANDYFYDFRSANLRSRVIGRLWHSVRAFEEPARPDARLEWLLATLSADPRSRSVTAPLLHKLRGQSQASLRDVLLALVPRVPPAFRARLMAAARSRVGDA